MIRPSGPGKRSWRVFTISRNASFRHAVLVAASEFRRTGHGIPCPYEENPAAAAK